MDESNGNGVIHLENADVARRVSMYFADKYGNPAVDLTVFATMPVIDTEDNALRPIAFGRDWLGKSITLTATYDPDEFEKVISLERSHDFQFIIPRKEWYWKLLRCLGRLLHWQSLKERGEMMLEGQMIIDDLDIEKSQYTLSGRIFDYSVKYGPFKLESE